MNLSVLAGPIIGSAIGYCTNYIAVKMLFFPRKEIKVFGHTLPFTPGAIPKGKPRLAAAIGDIVGNTLLTKDDIEDKIANSTLKDDIADMLIDCMSVSIKEIFTDTFSVSEESYEMGKEKLSLFVSEEIVKSLSTVDFSTIITEKCAAIVKEKVKGSMLQMFLSDDLIKSFTEPMGKEIERIIDEEGISYINPLVLNKLNEYEGSSALEILGKIDIKESDIKNIVSDIFSKMLSPVIDKIVGAIDISSIVKEKIDAMSIEDLESLVLKVMKKELNMIVNLGALIGLILGMINIFI